MDSDWQQSIKDEIEALKSTYMDELIVGNGNAEHPFRIFVTLHPLTCQNSNEQYVCLTLDFKISKNYPDESPIICVKSTRGLSDETIENLMKKAERTANDLLGYHSIYEIIETVREGLTSSNIPTEHCTICLTGFSDIDVFTKTNCYHYYHSFCLARYIKHVMEEIKLRTEESVANLPPWERKPLSEAILCPVCREELVFELSSLEEAPEPVQSLMYANFTITPEIEALQKHMKELMLSQKSYCGMSESQNTERNLLLSSHIDEEPTDVDNSSQMLHQIIRTKRDQHNLNRPVQTSRRKKQHNKQPHNTGNHFNDNYSNSVANNDASGNDTAILPGSANSSRNRRENQRYRKGHYHSSRKFNRGQYSRTNSENVSNLCNGVPQSGAHGQSIPIKISDDHGIEKKFFKEMKMNVRSTSQR